MIVYFRLHFLHSNWSFDEVGDFDDIYLGMIWQRNKFVLEQEWQSTKHEEIGVLSGVWHL